MHITIFNYKCNLIIFKFNCVVSNISKNKHLCFFFNLSSSSFIRNRIMKSKNKFCKIQ